MNIRGERIDTLDEPVFKTIGRDLLSVAIKLGHVIIPLRGREKELRNWDLWGPLILSFLLATTLTFAAQNQETLIFSGIFVIVWVGSFVVTINAILLGGKISFFQSVCVLGYCLGPLDIAAFACLFWDNIIYRILVVAVAFAWSVLASWGFVASMMPEEKRSRNALAVYPVFLFYLVISWMIVVMRDVAER
ncbi:Yip1 member 6 [Balamuthia mandrillaris]